MRGKSLLDEGNAGLKGRHQFGCKCALFGVVKIGLSSFRSHQMVERCRKLKKRSIELPWMELTSNSILRLPFSASSSTEHAVLANKDIAIAIVELITSFCERPNFCLHCVCLCFGGGG